MRRFPFRPTDPRPSESTIPGKKDIQLPPELWRIIVDLLIDEIRHPYLYCTPETSLQYHAYLKFVSDLGDHPFFNIKNWKNIRLVSWAWKELAGPVPHLYLRRYEPDVPTLKISIGVSSIMVSQRLDDYSALQALVQQPTLSNNLTTLILGNNLFYGILDVVLGNPSLFPNLRCLSFQWATSGWPFWKLIQDGYPQLVSLSIRGYCINYQGDYILKNLKFLETDLWNNLHLTCPSLKHLSLRNGHQDAVLEFLARHGHQLQSLIFDSYASYSTPHLVAQMWDLLPNIRILGRQVHLPLPSPPPGHPLQRIYVIAHLNSVTVDHVIQGLEAFSNITHIHIHSAVLRSKSLQDLRDLRARCSERNVELELIDVPIHFFRPILNPPIYAGTENAVVTGFRSFQSMFTAPVNWLFGRQ